MKLGAGLLLGLLALFVVRQTSAAAPLARYAIVVGNNLPDVSEPSAVTLRYADDDAARTHQLLLEAGVSSLLLSRFDADSERSFGSSLVAHPPTLAGLRRAFARQLARVAASAEHGVPAELFFVFSGHGDVADGEGFVVLEDGRLTRSELFELLSSSRAGQNHVFIDACKSYYLVFDRGVGGKRSPHTGQMPAQAVPGRLDNTGFVLSTSSDRDSHEWERYQGGILSHQLRSALRGAADTNRSGSVTYAELAAFLNKANEAIDNPRFRPDFMVRAPGRALEREVLGWPTSHATLRVGRAYVGPFYVETARGDRLLDAHPAPGQALVLHVPETRPLFVRLKNDRGEAVVVGTGSEEVGEWIPITPALASRGALSLALEGLFALPFADADVRALERRAAREVFGAVDEAPAPDPRQALRRASGVTAVVATGLGLASSASALATLYAGADEPQARRATLNRTIRTLNRVSLGCYGAALAAGAVWAWSTWWPRARVSIAPQLDAGTPLGLGLIGDF